MRSPARTARSRSTAMPRIYHGAAGLGSRDVRPGDIYRHLREHDRRWARTISASASSMPLALKVNEDPDLRRAGRVLDARPFGRRLRLGDDEQGHRHDRRRGVRQGRAGLSEVRLGKEGPADDVLPDDRRRRTSISHSELEYVDLVVLNDTTALFSGNPLDGLVAGGAIFMQSSFTEPERCLAADSGPRTRQIHPREEDPRVTSPTWCRSPATWPPRPTCRCGCRASCCWARS